MTVDELIAHLTAFPGDALVRFVTLQRDYGLHSVECHALRSGTVVEIYSDEED